MHVGVLPEGWSYDDGYPLPDTKDGVGLFLRHGNSDYGFHFVVRREDDRVIGEIGFVEPAQGKFRSRSAMQSSRPRGGRATRPRRSSR